LGSRNWVKDIWHLIEPFARYGFNKAHSVGYASSVSRRRTSRRTIRLNL
jgi:DNA polymerase III alpha subunit